MGEFFNREKEEVIENKDILFTFYFYLQFLFGRVSWLIELLVGLFLVRKLENSHAWCSDFFLVYLSYKINVNSRSLILLLRKIAYIYKWFVRQLYSPPSNYESWWKQYSYFDDHSFKIYF